MSRSRKKAETPAAPPALRPILGFVLRFAAVWAVALLLFALVPGIEDAAIANTVQSLITGASIAGVEAGRAGDFLHVGGVSIRIVPDCTPLMPIASLWAAVIAFPASLGWKTLGLIGGVAVLWLYNLLRIYALIAVLKWQPGWFEFIHVYLWQTVTLLVVFALFILWLRSQRPHAQGPPEAEPAAA